LGTVEDAARDELAAHGILSYRLVWFEEHPPETYPELALAAVSTHDLPTIAGVIALVSLAALAAAYIPSRRAARVDPASALRSE
jgi:4-alpha-glucanotransferase